MEANFIQLSDDILLSSDGIYLTKVDSAKKLSSKICDEYEEYGISFGDVTVDAGNCGGRISDAVRMEISVEDEDGYYDFIDIVVSDLLGTFVSEWF